MLWVVWLCFDGGGWGWFGLFVVCGGCWGWLVLVVCFVGFGCFCGFWSW